MSDSDGQIIDEGQTSGAMPTPEQPAENTGEPTLPDGVKDRTAEEFEKLKARNKAMAEEILSLRGGNSSPRSVLDTLRPNVATVPTVTAPFASTQPTQQLIDEGGFVDPALLNTALVNSQKAAEEARRIAQQVQGQIQTFQESQVTQSVHKDFPELDPNSESFDPDFFDYVRNDLVGQMMQGKEDLRSAAVKARKVLARKATTVQAVNTTSKETIAQREQATAPTGGSKGTPQALDREALVRGTFKGDKDAIYKRLQASGY